jgi:hypothetical protein
LKKFPIICGCLYLCAAALTISPVTALAEETQTEETAAEETEETQTETAAAETQAAETVLVEYGNLRELLKKGNLSLSELYSDYQRNVDDYQEMWDTMKWEQSKLETEADLLKDSDSEVSAVYSANASMLKRSATSVYKRLDTMTSDKSMKSLEKQADLYEVSAQTMMNSYNQLRERRQAQEATVNALEASYGATERKYQAGAATEEELKDSAASLSQAKNTLASLKEQEAQSKRSFLTTLGLATSDVVIGTIPEPDLAAIDAIDFETDKQKAVNNSSNVQNERHTKAASTTQINNRFSRVAEAEGSAEASITAAYEELLAARSQYEGALSSYKSAELIYQSLERKNQAGMLSNTEYLQGVAEYQSKKANKEIASMNLVQAYESYSWEVKGRA